MKAVPEIIQKIPGGNSPYTHYSFWCPGCKCGHMFHSGWNISGSGKNVTVSPSILIDKDRPERRCHLFIRNGKIQFCGDCHHDLKGQTVDARTWEEVINEDLPH